MSGTEHDTDEEVGQEQPFLAHLVELRDRLLRSVLAVLVLFLGLFPFANTLYEYVAGPLMAHLPEGSNMIAIDVATPFLTPFKLALVAAIFLAMPYLLYQAWAFIAPALYRHEKRLVFPLMVTSSLLFYAGIAFAYYIVFPLVFAFLTSTAPVGVEVMTDINRYLDFVLTIFFAFGLAFEVPIATILLVWAGITTPESLRAKRPYIIVGAFVVGMMLTPPDVISQTLLALPMWVLFELGIVFSRIYAGPRETEEDDDGAAGDYGEPQTTADDADAAPMSDAEMEAELDRLEAEQAALEAELEELGDDGSGDGRATGGGEPGDDGDGDGSADDGAEDGPPRSDRD
ncbi:MAG: twin-arginine translocase subunit TatC [Gammaproteobacteria bacterium]|nr:twin-arginine translocase subunit TatC [Gammaproteobacteria bacterium]